jgi:hypothetical protein
VLHHGAANTRDGRVFGLAGLIAADLITAGPTVANRTVAERARRIGSGRQA